MFAQLSASTFISKCLNFKPLQIAGEVTLSVVFSVLERARDTGHELAKVLNSIDVIALI